MKPDILERALRSVIPKQHIFEDARVGRGIVSSRKDGSKAVMTGTTIIAFPFNEGVIFAADRKVTGGYMSIISVDFKKLFRVAPFTVIGGAGTLGDVQHIVSMMEELNSGFIGKFEYPLSIKGQAKYLANYLRESRSWVEPFGLQCDIIIGGLNLSDDLAIFQAEDSGCLLEAKSYAVIGSGTDGAISVLREEKQKLAERKLNLDESVNLAVKAISRAGERDNGTADIRVANPNIVKITLEGCEDVDPDKVSRSIKNLLEQEASRG